MTLAPVICLFYKFINSLYHVVYMTVCTLTILYNPDYTRLYCSTLNLCTQQRLLNLGLVYPEQVRPASAYRLLMYIQYSVPQGGGRGRRRGGRAVCVCVEHR